MITTETIGRHSQIRNYTSGHTDAFKPFHSCAIELAKGALGAHLTQPGQV